MRWENLVVLAGLTIMYCSAAIAQTWSSSPPPNSYSRGAGQMPSEQDEGRREEYCRWDSESKRVEAIDSLNQKDDEASRADVAYILTNCPPSQASMQQYAAQKRQQLAESQSRYEAVSAVYQANGEFLMGGEGQVFDSGDGCSRFAAAQMKIATKAVHGEVMVAGDSVLVAKDDTGYVWYGCIHPDAYRTDAFTSYVGVKMTGERAETMRRFPGL